MIIFIVVLWCLSSSYIALLSKLYADQTSQVQTDQRSKIFNIERGTKQGDPLSSLLFNCVSESIMRKVKAKWNDKGWGIPLHPHHITGNVLTNLRFADDILVLAASLPQVREMIADLSTVAQAVGLHLHPDKTKILHNGCHKIDRAHRRTPSNVQILDMTIDILPIHDSTKYLG